MLSTSAASIGGLAFALGLSQAAFTLPLIGTAAVGDGVVTGARTASIQVGSGSGPPLVNANALSPRGGEQGRIANVMLLNNQRLVDVTGQKSAPSNLIGVPNPTGQPVFSSGSLPNLNGLRSLP